MTATTAISSLMTKALNIFVNIPLKRNITMSSAFRTAWSMNPNNASAAYGGYMLSGCSVSMVPPIGFLDSCESNLL